MTTLEFDRLARRDFRVGDFVWSRSFPDHIPPLGGVIVAEGTFSKMEIPVWLVRNSRAEIDFLPKDDAYPAGIARHQVVEEVKP